MGRFSPVHVDNDYTSNFEDFANAAFDQHERSSLRREQRDERDRQRRRQEADDAWRQVQQNIALMEAGGGRGAPPGSELDFGVAGMGRAPAPGARSRTPFGQWGGMELPNLEPEEPRPGAFGRAMGDPMEASRYVEVGAPGYEAYIENPRYRERKAEQDRQLRLGAIGSSIASFRDVEPDRARAAAALLDSDVATFGQLFPEEEPPYNADTDPVLQRGLEWVSRGFTPSGARIPPVTAGSGARGLPSYEQAVDVLTTMYPGEYEGETSLSPEVLHSRAVAMARGEDVDFGGAGAGSELDFYENDLLNQSLDRSLGAARRAPAAAPAAAASPTGASLTDSEVEAARAMLERFPRRHWQKILQKEGASAEDIARILGG